MLGRFLLSLITFATLVGSSAQAYDLYAAIAYSDSTGRWGYSFDNYTLADASVSAVSRCAAYDCRVKTWVRNGCAALARGYSGGLGWAYNDSLAYARTRAIQECNAWGYGCGIVAWACTSGHS